MKLHHFCCRFAILLPLALVFPLVTFAASGGTFINLGEMNVARDFHGVSLLPDGKVLIVGGSSFSGPLASAEVYDPATRTFILTGSMIDARVFCGAVNHPVLLANGKVLVLGGGVNFNILATAELYDETTGIFTATGSMSVPRVCPTVTLLADGKVLVAGGYDQTLTFLTSAEIYDPATGAFTLTTGNLVTARGGAIGTLLLDGTVLIVGGSGNTRGGLTSSEIYHPSSQAFTLTGSTIIATYYPFEAAARLNNGKVLVTGYGQPNAARLYDPSTGVFSETSQEHFEVGGELNISLKNGNVINVGPTGHLYVASAGQFIDGPKMIAGYGAAVLLNDGTVLVCGGIISTPLRRAGLYVPM